MDTRGATLDSDSADLDQSDSTNIDSQTGSILDSDSADFVPLHQDKSTSTTDLPTADDDATFDVELSNVQVDAVHPLFTEVFGTRRKRSVGTSTTEDRCQLYFCADCDTFIYKTWLDVTNHFLTIKHVPKHDCVYCGGAVFEYFDNRTILLHHKCDNISPSNCDQLDRSSKPGCDDKVNGKIKG